jgi:ribonuclease III
MAPIAHSFRDPQLWRQALTHRSWSHEHGDPDYERLEHLGDAVLALSVTTLLAHHLAASREGDLTHLRQQLVNAEALASLARQLGLDRLVRLGAGAEAGGSRDSTSVLSDVVEAVIGAVYQDAGFDAAHALVSNWFAERLAALVEQGGDPVRHPKSVLQETIQEETGLTPAYLMLEQRGPAHRPSFTVAVRLGEREIGRGDGASLREAERAAALDALAGESWRGTP